MGKPNSRKTFKEYCLRELGAPVIEINVDDDQLEDRIDYALQTFWDYHFNGADKCYYKYIIQPENLPMHISDISIVNTGLGYDNTDIVVITSNTGSSSVGTAAAANIVTDAVGAVLSVPISNSGSNYYGEPTVTITAANGASSNGTGAKLYAYNGGYIPIPDNIIGAVNIFNVGGALQSQNMFNIQYQIAMNDLYTLSSVSMVPYFMSMQSLQFLEYMLIGKQRIRYNRHKNKLYIDMNWERTPDQVLLVVECYQIVDPDEFTDAWNDRWLKLYCTALIKKQWGNNLKKYVGMEMPGRITFSGQQIYNEAVQEIKELEQRMIMDYGIPPMDFVG